MRNFLLVMVLLCSAWCLTGQSTDILLNVQEHTLANGLKILMVENHIAPRVTCHIYYKVGSINERPGITGIAHLHEHMMFKGTKMMGIKDFGADDQINQKIDALMDLIYREKFWKRSAPDEEKIAAWQKEVDALVGSEKALIIKDHLWETYMKNGGTGLNASTGQETTGYYVTLPSNKVELQMLLEADRMKDSYFREFYSEKDVVMEERRLSENRPGSLFDEQVNASFYASSPYHWDVIGWMDDLRKVTKADMEEFHRRYYVPNNAVAIYVGDFKPAEVIRLAEKHFGSLPRGRDVEPIRTAEVPQMGEKRLLGEGPATTSLAMYFHIPAEGQPDAYPLQLLADVLSGENGRLYRVLIKEKKEAFQAMAFARPLWYAGQFSIRAMPNVMANVTPEKLEGELWAEIEKIKADGVTPQELEKAKNRAEFRFVSSLQSMMLAMRLGRSELNRGWRSLKEDLEAMRRVTVEDIKNAAKQYLVRDNATIAIYRRKMGK